MQGYYPVSMHWHASMKVLVCGGRSYSDKRQIYSTLDAQFRMISEIVTGGAHGADHLAELWARERGVKLTIVRADWKKWGGLKAGPIRNEQMLKEHRPDLVIAFPGGKGTEHMIRIAKRDGIRVERHDYIA